MRPGSVHVSIVGFSPVGAGRDDVRMETMLVEPRASELATLLGMMTDGSLRVVVEEVTLLGAFVTAILALHHGHTTGKRLIAIQ
jgi:hypothetical protein